MSKNPSNELKIGLMNYKFIVKDGWLEYREGPFNAWSKISMNDISSVAVTKVNLGSSKVAIIGGGTVLTELTMPRQWAFKVQTFITEAIKHR